MGPGAGLHIGHETGRVKMVIYNIVVDGIPEMRRE